MAIPLRDSFIDVHLDEDELEQHVLDVIKARPTGPERRAAISYLRQIVEKDSKDIAHFRYTARSSRPGEAAHLRHPKRQARRPLPAGRRGQLHDPARSGERRGHRRWADPEPEPERHRRQRQLPRPRHGVRRRRDTGMRVHRQRQLADRRQRRADRGRRVQGPGGRSQDRIVRRRQPGHRVQELPIRRLALHGRQRPRVQRQRILLRRELLGLIRARKLRDPTRAGCSPTSRATASNRRPPL